MFVLHHPTGTGGTKLLGILPKDLTRMLEDISTHVECPVCQTLFNGQLIQCRNGHILVSFLAKSCWQQCVIVFLLIAVFSLPSSHHQYYSYVGHRNMPFMQDIYGRKIGLKVYSGRKNYHTSDRTGGTSMST